MPWGEDGLEDGPVGLKGAPSTSNINSGPLRPRTILFLPLNGMTVIFFLALYVPLVLFRSRIHHFSFFKVDFKVDLAHGTVCEDDLALSISSDTEVRRERNRARVRCPFQHCQGELRV